MDPAPAPTPIPSPLGVTCDVYSRACGSAGLSGRASGAAARYRRLFQEGDLSAHRTADGVGLAFPPITRLHESMSPEGRVIKFCLPVAGAGEAAGRSPGAPALETESVVIPMVGRKGHLTHTLCVSSQVGCAMGCVFCQTAQMGLLRDLTPEEIVRQWYAARWIAGGGEGRGCDTIRNIVFMGMGEPMDNLDNVLGAIEVLTDHRGPNMPMNKISISTVGRVDGIARLGARVREHGWHRLNLAVSLNAPNDEVRSRIMPINRAMPLDRLRAAIEAWPLFGGAKICFEYVLIPGVNDAREHAAQLGDFLLGRGVYAGRPRLQGLLNLIPYNPRDGSPWEAPDEQRTDAFLVWLMEEGVYAKRRRTKGRDTMAACGQLGNPALKKPRRVGVTVSAAPISE